MSWNFVHDRPIYAQLVEHIQRRVLSGEYAIGQRLPSIRELAAEAAVNPNTLQRAFAELENLGLVYAQRTAGRFITEDQEKISQIRQEHARQLAEEFLSKLDLNESSGDEQLEELLEGLSIEEIEQLLQESNENQTIDKKIA